MRFSVLHYHFFARLNTGIDYHRHQSFRPRRCAHEKILQGNQQLFLVIARDNHSHIGCKVSWILDLQILRLLSVQIGLPVFHLAKIKKIRFFLQRTLLYSFDQEDYYLVSVAAGVFVPAPVLLVEVAGPYFLFRNSVTSLVISYLSSAKRMLSDPVLL